MAATRAFPVPVRPGAGPDRRPCPGIAGLLQRLAHALGHGKYAAVQIPGHMRPVPRALGKALLPGHVVLQIRGLRRNHPRNDLKETALPLQFLT